MGKEEDHTDDVLRKSAANSPHLQKLKIKSIKILLGYESVLLFFTAISYCPNFQHFEWELLNCQVSDMEVIAFAQGLVKVKQLRYFSLKVIQNPNISEDCIEKVAGAISRLEDLSKFDLYFSKLSLHPQAIKGLGKRIESSQNAHCSCSKVSIHIYKTNNELGDF